MGRPSYKRKDKPHPRTRRVPRQHNPSASTTNLSSSSSSSSSSAAAAAVAVAKVLSLPELLELILLCIPRAELLTACQRVCKHWRDQITMHSPALRQYLFLSATLYQRPKTTPEQRQERKIEYNPLLTSYLPCLFPPSPYPLPTPFGRSRTFTPQQVTENNAPPPDLFHLAGSPPFPSGSTQGCLSLSEEEKEAEDKKREKLIDDIITEKYTTLRHKRHLAFIRKGASWRRMLVSIPVVRRVVRMGDVSLPALNWNWDGDPGSFGGGDVGNGRRGKGKERGMKVVDIPSGLTMGELYDEVFRINWVGRTRTWCTWEGGVRSAWVAWRSCWDGYEGGDTDESRESGGGDENDDTGLDTNSAQGHQRWRGVDMVIGENALFCSGCDCSGNWSKCFLLQDNPCWDPRASRRGPQWKYRCEEYRGESRLSLPLT